MRCGHPRRGSSCHWCDLLPPFVRAARSVAWTGAGSASSIVHALKYQGWWKVADGMAERMARLDWPADVIAERNALVPVPLAPARERERGFNQSRMLADALARRWRLPVWEQRQDNVSNAFRAAGDRREMRGAHVILVDDVVTTAATLVSCAAALHAGGARIVSLITFARAPADGDRV
jgi:predicted amidophosphoribosyltransferase